MARSRSTSNEPETPSTFPQRGLVGALAILLTFGVAAALSGELAGKVFRTFIYAEFVAAIALPAWMLGILLTKPFATRGCFEDSPWPNGFRSLVGLALGLGTLAIGTLLQGSLGLLSPGGTYWTAAILPAAAFLIGLGPTTTFLRTLRGKTLWAKSHRGDWVFLLAAVPVAMLLIAATFPPGTIWGATEAHGYDAMEYHLEMPREYAQNNSTAPVPHNIYSCLPANVEMLYLLLQQITNGMIDGNPTDGYVWGAFPAQFLHVLLTLLTAAAIGLMPIGPRNRDRPWLHPTGRAIAVLLFLGTPWTIVVGSLAYDEMGMMFFGTLALGLALSTPRTPDVAGAGEPVAAQQFSTIPRGVLIGLLLGLAVGCKLTAGVFFALPVAAVIAWRGFIDGRQWRMLAATILIATIVYGPWAIRAALYSKGNPFYPVATSLFGRGNLPPYLATRFNAAHGVNLTSTTTLGRLLERGKALADNSVMDAQWSVQPFALMNLLQEGQELSPPWKRLNLLLLIAPLAIAGAFMSRVDRATAGIILFVLLLQVLAWAFTTHLQARFLLPIAIPLALLAGRATQGLHLSAEGQLVGALRIATGTLVGLQGLCSIFILLPTVGIFGGAARDKAKDAHLIIDQPYAEIRNIAEAANTPATAAATKGTTNFPPAPTLLLGEATAWRFVGPLVYFTAFDENPVLDAFTRNDPAKAAALLQEKHIEYAWVSWFELARLQDTYGLGLEVPEPVVGDTTASRARQIAAIYGPRLAAAGFEDTHVSQDLTVTIYKLPRQP